MSISISSDDDTILRDCSDNDELNIASENSVAIDSPKPFYERKEKVISKSQLCGKGQQRRVVSVHHLQLSVIQI